MSEIDYIEGSPPNGLLVFKQTTLQKSWRKVMTQEQPDKKIKAGNQEATLQF